MTSISPTITALDPHAYRSYMEVISGFATRVHIDLADGSLTPNQLIPLQQVWWPGGITADLHVMYKKPFEYINDFLALSPQLVVVQAEAEGDFIAFAQTLHSHGIEAGVALLPTTPTEILRPAIDEIDHVLIFSGSLGSYGGRSDLRLLNKVAELRFLKPELEISWDGGINDQNAKELVNGGIEVLNVGSYISMAEQPQAAYETLQRIVAEAAK
jgi:ribulose-phosphate 3-epimerase